MKYRVAIEETYVVEAPNERGAVEIVLDGPELLTSTHYEIRVYPVEEE